jgi:hypothetical protein
MHNFYSMLISSLQKWLFKNALSRLKTAQILSFYLILPLFEGFCLYLFLEQSRVSEFEISIKLCILWCPYWFFPRRIFSMIVTHFEKMYLQMRNNQVIFPN